MSPAGQNFHRQFWLEIKQNPTERGEPNQTKQLEEEEEEEEEVEVEVQDEEKRHIRQGRPPPRLIKTQTRT